MFRSDNITLSTDGIQQNILGLGMDQHSNQDSLIDALINSTSPLDHHQQLQNHNSLIGDSHSACNVNHQDFSMIFQQHQHQPQEQAQQQEIIATCCPSEPKVKVEKQDPATTAAVTESTTTTTTAKEGPAKKRAKRACLNCRSSKVACDQQRPCTRCTKHGIEATCLDIPRKPKVCSKKPKVDKCEDDANNITTTTSTIAIPNSLIIIHNGQQIIPTGIDFFQNNYANSITATLPTVTTNFIQNESTKRVSKKSLNKKQQNNNNKVVVKNINNNNNNNNSNNNGIQLFNFNPSNNNNNNSNNNSNTTTFIGNQQQELLLTTIGNNPIVNSSPLSSPPQHLVSQQQMFNPQQPIQIINTTNGTICNTTMNAPVSDDVINASTSPQLSHSIPSSPLSSAQSTPLSCFPESSPSSPNPHQQQHHYQQQQQFKQLSFSNDQLLQPPQPTMMTTTSCTNGEQIESNNSNNALIHCSNIQSEIETVFNNINSMVVNTTEAFQEQIGSNSFGYCFKNPSFDGNSHLLTNNFVDTYPVNSQQQIKNNNNNNNNNNNMNQQQNVQILPEVLIAEFKKIHQSLEKITSFLQFQPRQQVYSQHPKDSLVPASNLWTPCLE
ncbi:hypothetical protein CYY_008750 [Polysphondylium violaceum]|uniref:Zn(2)-C6 fungal-type domain-containing protein n=1 Tax=Polysphondylium violaceum TaxID=133409 RepID=A0A8J4UPZ2_9MYCE|nr:hypothetical protein CYY_008750 [Polysphondylium violaceum]